MKIALVHELLTMKGGAEKVLRIAAAMFPEAPIYTLLYDEKALGDWFPRKRVRTSRLQRYAGLSTNHHLYLPFFPRAVEAWDFSGFDLVLSFSSAFTHGIITNSAPRHLCYVHSPARYLWDRTHDVLQRAARGPLGRIRHAYLSRTFHALRMWDAESSARPDKLLAASKEVQRRIELYWRKKSDVLYPPIDDHWFRDERRTTNDERPYYLIVSQLARYKRIDLAIEACNQRKTPLKIAGRGPDEARLRRIGGPTVEFLGYQSEEALRGLYASARATLFPGDEDFGLVPLESQASGTPVIAYRGGGALETVIENRTGMFFAEPTAASLCTAMEHFDRTSFDPAACRAQAQRFSRDAFERNIRAQVESLS